MKTIKKRVISLVTVVFIAAGILLTGCGNKNKTTNLVWYVVGSEQRDLSLVNEEINKILKEKINATVDIKMLDWSAYDQKMNLIISTKEEFDLCWTAPQFNDYYTNIGRGAFMPLDELLEKYGKETYSAIDKKFWDAARVDGKIYGVINYQMMATGYGVMAQRPMLNESGFDIYNISDYKSIEPLLAYIKANHPELIPLGYDKVNDPFSTALPMYGFSVIGSNKTPGAVRLNDDSMTVVNQYETPEFEDLINTMHSWYTKGYIKADAATSEEYSADLAAGKVGVIFPAFLLNDATEPSEYDDENQTYSNTGIVYKSKRFGPTYLSTERVLATMTAISSTSKHPETAMKMIELFNTDEELYNLICWGIEGKHYKKVDYTQRNVHVTVEPIENSGYAPNTEWMFGNTKNLWMTPTTAPSDKWEPYNNEKGYALNTLGFSFDTKNVTSEIAMCSSVVDEYLNSLVSGSIEPTARYKEFLEKLKTAGADKIVAEKQKQLDEWLKNK